MISVNNLHKVEEINMMVDLVLYAQNKPELYPKTWLHWNMFIYSAGSLGLNSTIGLPLTLALIQGPGSPAYSETDWNEEQRLVSFGLYKLLSTQDEMGVNYFPPISYKYKHIMISAYRKWLEGKKPE